MITPNTFTATGWAIIVCLGIGFFVWGVVIAPYRERKAIERRIGEIDAKAEAQANELRDVGIDTLESHPHWKREYARFLCTIEAIERHYHAVTQEQERYLNEMADIRREAVVTGEEEVCDTSACADV